MSSDDPETGGCNAILSFMFELFDLEAEQVTFNSLTNDVVSLIAEESRENSQKYLVKITKFVRLIFDEIEDYGLLFQVLDKFRSFLERIRIKPEGSLISGQFSLVVVEQIMDLELLDEELKLICVRALELYGILVLRSRPALPCSIEFIKLFCEVMEHNFTVFLMSVNVEYVKKFFKNWLLGKKKVIENKLLICILRYILNDSEALTKRAEIAECFTTKEFLYYFHNTIENSKTFDLVCCALELSNNVAIFTSKEYLCWLNEAILEANEIIKKRLIRLYNDYRVKAGHRNSDILQDVIKAFSYEENYQKCNKGNIFVICENILYIQNPSNVINGCILDESFNDDFGHISFKILKTIIEIYSVKIAHNLSIRGFFKAIPELLKHFNNKSFEKCQILDICLKLESIWRYNPETVSI